MQAVRYFSIPGTFAHSPVSFRGDVAVHATIVNKRSKHQSADCFSWYYSI